MPLVPKVGRKKWKIKFILIGITSLMWIGVALHLFPVWWAFVLSISPAWEAYEIPPPLFPRHPTFMVYKYWLFTGEVSGQIFKQYSFLIYLKNSVILAAGTIAIQIPIIALAAYSLSKLHSSKWSRVLFLFFIGTMLVPGQLSLVPRYLLLYHFPFATANVPHIPFIKKVFPTFNFMDTYWAVILPAIYSAFHLLLFKGFFDTIPDSIIQAARLDGASELSIFGRIVFPVSKPVFAVVGYFAFTTSWNQFLWPLIVLKEKSKIPLSVALYELQEMGFAASHMTEELWDRIVGRQGMPVAITTPTVNIVMALAIIQGIPMFIAFIIFREQIMKGIKLRGFK